MVEPDTNVEGQRKRWVRLICCAVMIVALGVYAASRPATWSEISGLAAIAFGAVFGAYITRRRWWLTVVPLIGFSVGGYITSTQFSNTRAYGGGDWSVAAVVALGGVWAGLIAMAALLATVMGRGALRIAARQFVEPGREGQIRH